MAAAAPLAVHTCVLFILPIQGSDACISGIPGVYRRLPGAPAVLLSHEDRPLLAPLVISSRVFSVSAKGTVVLQAQWDRPGSTPGRDSGNSDSVQRNFAFSWRGGGYAGPRRHRASALDLGGGVFPPNVKGTQGTSPNRVRFVRWRRPATSPFRIPSNSQPHHIPSHQLRTHSSHSGARALALRLARSVSCVYVCVCVCVCVRRTPRRSPCRTRRPLPTQTRALSQRSTGPSSR